MEITDILLPPCPKCGSEVEWTNCRDLDILSSHIQCTADGTKCDLQVFNVDSTAFIHLASVDYLTTALKYCQWAATNPETYAGEKWTHYTKL